MFNITGDCMRFVPLLAVSLLVCLTISPIAPTYAGTVQKTLTKVITYDYSYYGDNISLYATLSLGYEFNIMYRNPVVVNNPISINISASDVDINFIFNSSFEWEIPLVGIITGSLYLDWDSTMSLGYYVENDFSLDGTLAITVETWRGSDTYNVSFTLTGYIETLLNIINGIISVNGTAIPPNQWVYENVTWTSNNSTYTISSLRPNSVGIIHVDVINPRIFIVPVGLFIENLTIHDVPGIGDVTIPINYGWGIHSSEANSSKSNFYIMQKVESYPLGSFSVDIKVITPLEANMIWIMLGVIVIAVVAIIVIKRK